MGSESWQWVLGKCTRIVNRLRDETDDIIGVAVRNRTIPHMSSSDPEPVSRREKFETSAH
jgi:hypothetical protein